MRKTINFPWLPLAASALFVCSLLNSASVAESSRIYLRLCGEKVVPSLFVFSVLAAVICGSGAFYRLCSVFPFWGTETALLLMGMLGGFPLGATVATELYDNGSITKRQAEYLCAFTNNPSLSFTVSFVGGALGSKRLGAYLAVLTVIGAIASAAVLRFTFLKKNERRIKVYPLTVKSKGIATALREGSTTMLVICGCVVFFGSICRLLPKGVGGFLELSGGIVDCKTATEAAVLLGFSGVSVIYQVAAVCKGRLSVMPFITSKLLQSAVMGILSYFLFDFTA